MVHDPTKTYLYLSDTITGFSVVLTKFVQLCFQQNIPIKLGVTRKLILVLEFFTAIQHTRS